VPKCIERLFYRLLLKLFIRKLWIALLT